MIHIPKLPPVLITQLYTPIHLAKHSEQEDKKFIVYDYNGDFLLRDQKLDLERKIITIPPRFQQPEITNTIWEHFKSTTKEPMTYQVYGLGMDLDRFERFVLYVPLYQNGQKRLEVEGANCLARPEKMFFSEVERDGYKGKRFRQIR